MESQIHFPIRAPFGKLKRKGLYYLMTFAGNLIQVVLLYKSLTHHRHLVRDEVVQTGEIRTHKYEESIGFNTGYSFLTVIKIAALADRLFRKRF